MSKLVFDEILVSINQTERRILFLDAPVGIGKTFLINLLLAKIKSKKDIALTVASSGIPVTLLKGGRTAHSTLKLPLDMINAETSICNITKQSDLAKLLSGMKLLWHIRNALKR